MRPARKSQYLLSPSLDESQTQERWVQTSSKLHSNARRRRVAGVGAAALVLTVAAAVGFLQLRPVPTWDGAAFEAASGPQQLTLADGSQLGLEQRTKVSSCTSASGDVCVQLERGVGTFHVTKRTPGHSFFVHLGEVEVRVVGTRFTVMNDEQGSEVVVHEGIVETRVKGGKPVRLTVGQRLAFKPEPEVAVVLPPRPRAPVGVAPATGLPQTANAPSGGDGWQAKDTADELWQRALGARRGGDLKAQERAYDEFLVRYPADLRWGLAALELGRLRMDVLHDPAGAVQVFERALTNGVQSSLGEEALYRLSRSYQSLGRTEAALTICQRYLREYPGGAQVKAMAASCAHH